MKNNTKDNDNSEIVEMINTEEIFFCDYFTFQFCDETVRTRFISVLESLLGKMRTHEIGFDTFDRYRIPPQIDQILALTSRELKKKNEIYLSFYGFGAQEIQKVLFNEKILKFVKNEKNDVQIKRLDYKVFIESEIDKNTQEDSRSLLMDILINEISEKNETTTQMITSDTGWTFTTYESSKRWRTRIYAYEKKPRVKETEISKFSQEHKKTEKIENKKEGIVIEVQLSKTLTNFYTKTWKEKSISFFLAKALKDFIKGVAILKPSKIITLYKQRILPRLEFYFSILDSSSAFNKSLKSRICYKTSENERFLQLESEKEYVALISIYRGVINRLKREQISIERFKSYNFIDPASTRIFSFYLDELLDQVGLPPTPHYKMKIKRYLGQLQKYNISFQNSRITSFHSLITSLTVCQGTVQMSVNMRVLVALIEPCSQINLEIFTIALSQYTDFAGNRSKTKSTYPNFFFPLLCQAINAIDMETLYSGMPPRSGTAFKNFKMTVNWIFEYLIPQFSDLKKEDLEVTTDKNQVCIKTKRGKFCYPLFRKINLPDNELPITPIILSIEGIEEIKKMKTPEEMIEKLKKQSIDRKKAEEIKKIKEEESKEEESKEEESKEEEIKEIKEQESKEQESKEQESKEEESKEEEIKEIKEIKEQESKEQEIKEQESKEQESKEEESKGREEQESKGREELKELTKEIRKRRELVAKIMRN